jgi:KaiC/GvpD/RAD55 family RecA-like ATPase
MTLLEPHRQKLHACGLSTETSSRARLHSGSPAEVRELLGYGVQGGGLVIPYDDGYARVRIDHPGPDGKRYRSPAGQGNRLYVPPTLAADVLADVSIPLHVTEGEFKSLKACQDGIPCLALPGVWSWKTRVHGKAFAIPDLDRVVWKRRKVVIVFDSDLAEKPTVAWAEHALICELRARGAEVYILRLPDGPKGAKVGLDDYLAAEGIKAFRQLPMQNPQEADTEASPFRRMSDIADEYLLRLAQPYHRIQLGYAGLDVVLRGIAPGEVMTALARPGVGKTALLMNLMQRMSADAALPTLFFSLEQQAVEVFERMASMFIGWAGREIEDRSRAEDPLALAQLRDVVERWQHCVIVEKPCTLEQLDALIEQARAAPLWPDPLRLVVVDYLGVVGLGRPGPSLYEQTSRVARTLKNLAKRHRVALLVACQVDREGGSGGEPISLKMARDSGAIEEAADYLLGLWRPALNDKLPREERLAAKGQLVVRVLKNRSGPAPKTVTLHFDPTTLRIEALPSAAPVPGEPAHAEDHVVHRVDA